MCVCCPGTAWNQQVRSQWRWGDSNSGPPPGVRPGGGCAGGLTCGPLSPVVTAGARCSPLPAGSACTHCVPAGSGAIRSQTLRCSVLHDTRGSMAITPPVAVVPGWAATTELGHQWARARRPARPRWCKDRGERVRHRDPVVDERRPGDATDDEVQAKGRHDRDIQPIGKAARAPLELHLHHLCVFRSFRPCQCAPSCEACDSSIAASECRPLAPKARSGGVATCDGTERRWSSAPWRCPWLSAEDR